MSVTRIYKKFRWLIFINFISIITGHRSRKAAKKFNSNGIGAQFIAVSTTSSPVVPTAVVAAAPSPSNNAAATPSSSDSSVVAAAPTSSAAAAPYAGSYGSGY